MVFYHGISLVCVFFFWSMGFTHGFHGTFASFMAFNDIRETAS